MTTTLPESPASVPVVGPDTSVAEAFRARVKLHRALPALTTAEQTYTYADIDRWSDAIAARLMAAGVSPDRPVAIFTADNVALVPAVMAVLKAGHFFVVVDASDPDERSALILEYANAGLCLADSPSSVPAAAQQLPLVEIGPLPDGNVPPPPEAPANELLFAIFTSGTTGKPKGIAFRQRGWVQKRSDPSSNIVSGTHRIAYIALPGFIRTTIHIIRSLFLGWTLCAFDAREQSLSAMAAWIRRERVTYLSLSPALFRSLVGSVPDQLDLSSVQWLVMSSDVVTPADVEAFKKYFPRGAVLHCCYGSSEAGEIFRILIDHDTPIPGPLVPMGRLVPGNEVLLLNEQGLEVPDGETGELVVCGPDTVDGYWKAPDLTARQFIADPGGSGIVRFHSGDLVRRDADGLYYFMGRNDARLKIRGRRIDPVEAEAALVAAGGIREAVVVGKPDATGSACLVAYVVPEEGTVLDPRAVRAAMRAQVVSWLIPQRIFALDEIPVTPAGKVDRRSLSERVDPDREPDAEIPDAVEAQLLEIWSRVLGTTVHVEDDFFDDLGGESIVAANLVAAIEKEMRRSIPLSQLVNLNTVRKLAHHLRTSDGVKPLAITVQQGTTPPLFIVCALFGSVMRFRDLAIDMGPEHTVVGLTSHGFDIRTFPNTRKEIVDAFTAAVREVQPSGPYHLAGYSWGGPIAFLIAQALEAAGEPVAFVGAIDTPPEAGAVAPSPVQKLFRFLKAPLHSIENARQRRKNPHGWMAGDWHPRMSLVAIRILRMALEPSPAKYSGKVTVLRARDGMAHGIAQRDLGWSSFAPGPVEILDVKGGHYSIMSDAVHRKSLADALVKALQRCDRVQPAPGAGTPDIADSR